MCYFPSPDNGKGQLRNVNDLYSEVNKDLTFLMYVTKIDEDDFQKNLGLMNNKMLACIQGQSVKNEQTFLKPICFISL